MMTSVASARRFYLDFNGSTPIAPEVSAAMRLFSTEGFGNPSSTHWAAAPARAALAAARQDVAAVIGCEANEVVFTSGGSESNNLAIKGVVLASEIERPHVITTAVEHPSVLEVCAALERRGARITRLGVDRAGRLDPRDVEAAIDVDTTVLVSVMWANNEVGTIQPIREISEITAAHGIVFHSDAAQAVGKIDVSGLAGTVDLLTVAGHKLYAPKGIGALVIRRGLPLEPLIHGGGQEGGVRSGTESAMLAAALGAACRLALEEIPADTTGELRSLLWNRLRAGLGEGVVFNGHATECLPNTLNVSFAGWRGADLLARLEGVAASTGSACHDASTSASPVLLAMGLSVARAAGAIRFSLGRSTTAEEIEAVAKMCLAVCTDASGHRRDES